MLPGPLQLPVQCGTHGGKHGVQALPQGILVGNRQLSRVGRGGCPQIRYKVGNGHIRFMSHSRDHGNFRMVNGVSHPFIIKGPKIFDGTTAPAHDQKVSQPVMIGIADGCGNLTGGFHALHPYRQQQDFAQRIPLAQNPKHIVHRSAGGAGDDTDGTGIFGQRLFVGRIKQALGRQSLLQLFKGSVQIPNAVHSHGGTVQLIGTVSGEHRNLTHGNDLHAVFRPESEPHGIALEQDTPEGSGLIFQRKVMMAGGIELIVADLALDSHLIQQLIRIHPAFDVFVQLGNG